MPAPLELSLRTQERTHPERLLECVTWRQFPIGKNRRGLLSEEGLTEKQQSQGS